MASGLVPKITSTRFTYGAPAIRPRGHRAQQDKSIIPDRYGTQTVPPDPQNARSV